MTFSENIMPCVGNMIYPSGIGPIILTGFNSQEIINLLLPWQIFWQSLNILGGVSFCCAMISIFNKLLQQKISRSNYLSYMIPLLFILYLFPICLSYANDRYLLFLLPFLLLAYTLSFNFQFKKILFLISIISLMFFSVAGTHDYMNFHRTRWQAGDHLTKDLAVSPANIDGGFEFNAWYLYGSESYNPQHIGRWWWVENDMYIITPTIIQGFTIESKYKCLTWLSHNLEYIYVLKQSTNNAK